MCCSFVTMLYTCKNNCYSNPSVGLDNLLRLAKISCVGSDFHSELDIGFSHGQFNIETETFSWQKCICKNATWQERPLLDF